MGEQSISSNSFRYAAKENAQNSDQFYTVKDTKHNVFGKFDTNMDGKIDSLEAQNNTHTNEDGEAISLFQCGFDNLDIDKSSEGITQYELAAACSYLDSLDGEKDGIIKSDSYNKFSTEGLKTAYDDIQNWKTGYDTKCQEKLQQTIDMVQDNKDYVSNSNLLGHLDKLELDGSIKAQEYYDDHADTRGAAYVTADFRRDNTIIGLNKERLYEYSPEILSGALVHELTHYDEFENKPDAKYTLDSEANAFYNEFEYIRQLEDEKRNEKGTLAKVNGFLQDLEITKDDPAFENAGYQWYRQAYLMASGSPNREGDMRRQIKERLEDNPNYKDVPR